MPWTPISDTQTQHRAIGSVQLIRGLRDNALFAAGGIWQPWDMVEPSDGATGIIYDHAVDGNIVSIPTPDFESGYDYRLIYSQIDQTGSFGRQPEIEIFRDSDGAYSASQTIGGGVIGGESFGWIEVINPRGWARPSLSVEYVGTDSDGDLVAGHRGTQDGTEQTCSRLRFSLTAGQTIIGGWVALQRRTTIFPF